LSHAAGGLQIFDYLIKLDVFVSESVEEMATSLLKEIGEGGRLVDAAPQNDRVDEEANHPFEFQPLTATRHGADCNIPLAGMTGEKQLAGSYEDDKQCASVLACKKPESIRRFRSDFRKVN
jgi:hypothetical protein